MKIFYFPAYSNPYQSLLYDSFSAGITVKPGTIEEALNSIESRQDKVVFHLHWEDILFKNEISEDIALANAKSFLNKLRLFQEIGGKVIWTIHNFQNHERIHARVEFFLREKLALLCDSAFIHSRKGLKEISSRFPSLVGKVFVITHGNYFGVYPKAWSRNEAKKSLGYRQKDRVFLVFGDIRRHKRLDFILQAQSLCRGQKRPVNLLIAGRVYPEVDLGFDQDNCPERIKFIPGRVPDHEVSKLFMAADFTVFASDSLLTSSSLILALSMGVPVIAMAAGDALELIEEGKTGFLVRGDNPESLAAVLRRAAFLSESERFLMAGQALEKAATLDWKRSAGIIERALKNLFRKIRSIPGIDEYPMASTSLEESAEIRKKPGIGKMRGKKASAELKACLGTRKWTDKFHLYDRHLDYISFINTVSIPMISVIVISWRLHRDNLESFRILEKQRGLNFELIFVDNGAPEGEFRELEPYIDTYVRLNGNTGAYLARNLGAVFARAPILLFLEDDGIPAENLLAAHLGLFKKYDLIACRGLYVPKTDNPLNRKQAHYYMGPNDYPSFAHVEGNTSYLAEAFFQVGGWDDEINFGGGGAELYLRLLEFDPDKRRQIYSPKPVIYHDYVKDEQHLQTKLERQRISHERLRKKYPQWDQVHAEARLHSDRDDLVKQRVERVLLVNHAIPPFENSGTPISTWNHARGLQKLGIETAVLVPSACEVRVGFKKEDLNGITLYSVPRFDKHRAFLRQIDPKALLLQLYALERICKDFRPDIIQVNDYVYLPMEALALFHDLGVPVVRCVCNDEEICHQDYPVISEGLDGYLCSGPETAAKCAECFLARVRGLSRNNMPELELTRMEKLLADRAENTRKLYAEKIAGVIFTSHQFRDHFSSFVPISPDKIRIIPRGFEKPETAGLKKSRKTRSELRFAYFGTMLFSKGIDLILKAFAKTASNKGFRLDLYGIMVVPEFLNRINQLAEEFPGRIKYHGPYDPEDFPGLAAGSDLVIVPSFFDTYNRVLREALALGLPVIAADFFGSFIVQNEVNGLKFPVGDSEALAAAMNRLLTEPGLLKNIRAGAGKTLIPSLEDEIRAMVEFYRDILFERRVLKKDSIPPAAKKKKESMAEALADQSWTIEDGMHLRDIDRLLLSVIENSLRLPVSLSATLLLSAQAELNEDYLFQERIIADEHGFFSVEFPVPGKRHINEFKFIPWSGYWGRVRLDDIQGKKRSGGISSILFSANLESNGFIDIEGHHVFKTCQPEFSGTIDAKDWEFIIIKGRLEIFSAEQMQQEWKTAVDSILLMKQAWKKEKQESLQQKECELLSLAVAMKRINTNPVLAKKPLVVFGTGVMAQRIMLLLDRDKLKISCFFDNQPSKTTFHGRPVKKPHYISGVRVVIASMYQEVIKNQLKELGFRPADIISLLDPELQNKMI